MFFFLVEKTIDNLSHFTRRLKIYNLEKKYKNNVLDEIRMRRDIDFKH